MTKEFKSVSIAIIILGGLLFLKERKAISQEKEQTKNYMATKAIAKKSLDDAFTSNQKNITRNDQNINKCLALVKPVPLQTVNEDEVKFFAGALATIHNMRTDSIEKADTASVLHHMNKENTMIIYYDKMENPFLPLTDEIKVMLGESDYMFKLSGYTDFTISEKETTIKRAANLEYIVIAQPEKIKNAEIVESKSFSPGYLLTAYDVYHLASGKKVKSSSLLSSNSESLYTFRNSSAKELLRSDLMAQSRNAVEKTIYATN